MNRTAALGLALLFACNGEPVDGSGESGVGSEFVLIPADDDGTRLDAAVAQGLRTAGKGPDLRRFVLIRALDRHDPRLPDTAFHFVIGGGAQWPAGSIRVRRLWTTSGEVDGDNAELERYAVSVGIERGAPRPFGPAVLEAAGRICAALARPGTGVELHPDCVLAMGEAPFTKPSELDTEERQVAAAARMRVPPPTPDGDLTIDGKHVVPYEQRVTTIGREIGMMMRKSFDGPNRGMLFIYPHRATRRFWMRNCFIPIDLAYVKAGKIVQLETMPPQPGVPTADLPRYESVTPVRFVLEMPAGWFAAHGVEVGDPVEGLPE